VVPFTSFSEFNKAEGGDIWFALDESLPLACFAGIWTNWTSVRKVRLSTTYSRSSRLSAIHPNAMPGILTTPAEVETSPLTTRNSKMMAAWLVVIE
jgi:putative SOS response-associated peptidase YedK